MMRFRVGLIGFFLIECWNWNIAQYVVWMTLLWFYVEFLDCKCFYCCCFLYQYNVEVFDLVSIQCWCFRSCSKIKWLVFWDVFWIRFGEVNL
jgi:hypothetical protein